MYALRLCATVCAGNVFRAAGLPDLNAGYSFGRFSNGLVW